MLRFSWRVVKFLLHFIHHFLVTVVLIHAMRAVGSNLPRIKASVALIDRYKEEHSLKAISTLSATELCNKNFIVSTAACRDAGNGIGIFLDNLVWAVILNRTIILQWNRKTNFCKGSLRIQDWVVNSTSLQLLTANAGCPVTVPENMNHIRLKGSLSVLSCCGVEMIKEKFLSPGLTSKNSFDKLRPERGSLLSPFVLQRSKVLFSHPHGLASFEAHGFLALKSLEFTSVVYDFTRDIMPLIYSKHQSNHDHHYLEHRGVTIGVQVRHQKLNTDTELVQDDHFEKCLIHYTRNLITTAPTDTNSSNKQSCVLLIAADRVSTVRRLEILAPKLGCVAKYVPRNMSQANKGEHGPWGESQISVADFYLLSQAQYFLGSKQSSFSTLMLNIIVAKASLRSLYAAHTTGTELSSLTGMISTALPYAWAIG